MLFVGGDFARKGGRDLIAAWRAGGFARIADLDIVTDDPAVPAGHAGLRVLRGVASYSNEWAEAWRRADLFVMPTTQDAFGLVFQEAAAAGVARIGTRVNAVPEMIADSVVGPSRDAGRSRRRSSARCERWWSRRTCGIAWAGRGASRCCATRIPTTTGGVSSASFTRRRTVRP